MVIGNMKATARWRGPILAAVLATGLFDGACTALAADLAADEVRLTNGDRITGDVQRLEAGKLILATTYAGELEIAWEAVTHLTTDEPATVVLTDGTRLRGYLTTPEDPKAGAPGEGRAVFRSPDLEVPLPLELARIEAIDPPEVPPLRLSGGVHFSLVSARGNTETDSLVLQGEVQARTEASRYTLGAQVNESEEDGNETASRESAFLGYDLFWSDAWYLASDARFTRDELQDLELRTSAGLGIGRQFWERDRSELSLEVGASYVDENFLLAEDESFAAGRWALALRLPVARAVSFFHRQDGLLSLESSDDILVQSQTGLRFSLPGSFAATAQVSYDWDNSPAPGSEKEDTTLLLTLGYEW